MTNRSIVGAPFVAVLLVGGQIGCAVGDEKPQSAAKPSVQQEQRTLEQTAKPQKELTTAEKRKQELQRKKDERQQKLQREKQASLERTEMQRFARTIRQYGVDKFQTRGENVILILSAREWYELNNGQKLAIAERLADVFHARFPGKRVVLADSHADILAKEGRFGGKMTVER